MSQTAQPQGGGTRLRSDVDELSLVKLGIELDKDMTITMERVVVTERD